MTTYGTYYVRIPEIIPGEAIWVDSQRENPFALNVPRGTSKKSFRKMFHVEQ